VARRADDDVGNHGKSPFKSQLFFVFGGSFFQGIAFDGENLTRSAKKSQKRECEGQAGLSAGSLLIVGAGPSDLE
jgi:hypothetical protein